MENLNPGYIYVPYALNTYRLPLAGKLILSAISTYSKGEERRANFSFTTLSKKMHRARSTVAANVKELKSKGLATQKKQLGKSSLYQFSGNNTDKHGSFRFDFFLLTEEFEFRGGTSRRLKASEALILAFLASYGEKGFEGNVSTIARMLDVAPKTAHVAVRALMACGWISRPVCGKNNYLTSEFHADLSRLRALRKKHRRAGDGKEMVITYQTQAQKDEQARIEYEKRVAALKQAEEERAERVRRYCLTLPEYKSAQAKFSASAALARSHPDGSAAKNAAVARKLEAVFEMDCIKKQVEETLFPNDSGGSERLETA